MYAFAGTRPERVAKGISLSPFPAMGRGLILFIIVGETNGMG